MKRRRLLQENLRDDPYYSRACGLVLSHLNPWFGGSIVPYSCHLNWRGDPGNVIFSATKTHVIGKATMAIPTGTELSQAYADADAEFLYRYGFVPSQSSEDVVSFTLRDLDHPPSDYVTWLQSAELLEDSPWDGVDLVTAEIDANLDGLIELIAIAIFLTARVPSDPPSTPVECAVDLTLALTGDTTVRERIESAFSSEEDDDDDDDESPWLLVLSILRSRCHDEFCEGIRQALTYVEHRSNRLVRPPAKALLPRRASRMNWRSAERLYETERRILDDIFDVFANPIDNLIPLDPTADESTSRRSSLDSLTAFWRHPTRPSSSYHYDTPRFPYYPRRGSSPPYAPAFPHPRYYSSYGPHG